jgi:hypothetical protein
MMRCLRLVLAACVLAAGVARADESELERRVHALERALAELPATLDAVHDLENRVNALEWQLAGAGAARAADAEVRRSLDALDEQLHQLERRLARTQPGQGAGGFALGHADDGVYLRLDEPNVRVRLDAGVQARLTGGFYPAPTPNGAGFDVHHAELGLRGDALGWLAVETRFDFGYEYARAGAAMIRDVFLEVRPASWVTLRVGQLKVPFSRQRQIDELAQTFIERPLAVRAFAPDRDLGARVDLAFFAQRLLVSAAVTDGVNGGVQLTNDNRDLAYTVRVVAQPLGPLPLVEGDRARMAMPRFSVGGAFQYNLVPTDLPPPLDDVDRDGRVDNVEVITAGAELAARWRGYAVESEYFFRRERPGAGRADRTYQGVFGQASAMLWRSLEAAARVGWTELPRLGTPSFGVLGDSPARALEVTGSVHYYVWGERVKAQLAYTFRHDDASEPSDKRLHEGHLVELQLQAGF